MDVDEILLQAINEFRGELVIRFNGYRRELDMIGGAYRVSVFGSFPLSTDLVARRDGFDSIQEAWQYAKEWTP